MFDSTELYVYGDVCPAEVQKLVIVKVLNKDKVLVVNDSFTNTPSFSSTYLCSCTDCL